MIKTFKVLNVRLPFERCRLVLAEGRECDIISDIELDKSEFSMQHTETSNLHYCSVFDNKPTDNLTPTK